jgi:uncharacterized protein
VTAGADIAEAEPDPRDAGPARGGRVPARTCIVTRQVRPPDAMIRFALGPDGAVVPDLRARLPGRGVWVGATRAEVALAVRRRLFPRAFRTPGAAAPSDLADTVARLLRDDLRQGVALANKAGMVVAGFAKVEGAVAGEAGVAALIHAAEASPDGRRKLAQALRRRAAGPISTVPVIDDLSEAELDMALGRDHVIHAALVAGAGSNGCLARWRRLRTFLGTEQVPDAAEAAVSGPDANLRGDTD